MNHLLIGFTGGHAYMGFPDVGLCYIRFGAYYCVNAARDMSLGVVLLVLLI